MQRTELFRYIQITGRRLVDVPSSGNGSVSYRVYEMLRKKILSTEFKPGERMVEAKIAKAFGVSITPVREAFSVLVKQGLLTTFPYCGTYVTILSYEDACELIVVRKAIETTAAQLAFSRLKPEDADYLENLCLLADNQSAAGEYLASIECDVQFHELFFQRANNTLLREMWDITKSRVAFFQSITRPDCQAAIPLLRHRHQAIVDAVRKMDLSALCDAIGDHLDITIRRAQLPHSDQIVYR